MDRWSPGADCEADICAARPSLVLAAVNGMVFLAGLWLALSPWALDFRSSGDGFSGYWNERVAGTTLIVCGAASLIEPAEYWIWRPMQWVTGVWLAGTPFFFSHYADRGAAGVVVVDVIVGAIVLGVPFLVEKILRWSPPVMVRRQWPWTC